MTNGSVCADDRWFGDPDNQTYAHPSAVSVAMAVTILAVIIATVVGNALVCAAVFSVRKLRHPCNYLLVSLAVADLLVGLLVMPFAGFYQLHSVWILGPTACLIWTTSDVLLCTASILNLCAISVDRYLAIVKPLNYGPKRTRRRMLLYVLVVWVLAFLISVVPGLLFSVVNHLSEPSPEDQCQVNQSIAFQIYACMGSFYIPVSIMLLVNYKIFHAARKLAQQDRKASGHVGHTAVTSDQEQPLFAPNHRNGDTSRQISDVTKLDTFRASDVTSSAALQRYSVLSRLVLLFDSQSRPSALLRSETKATKTLGIIMGAFTLCWTPFFIVALLKPLCNLCTIPLWLDGLILWLGYINSTLNPIIYAKFNRDFRIPFREILCCRCSTLQEVVRSEMYAENFGNPIPNHLI